MLKINVENTYKCQHGTKRQPDTVEPILDNALLRFLQQDRDLITDNRPLRLRLDHPTQMLEDVLLPQRVHGTEAICGSLEYRVLCVSLDSRIPLKELIALPAAIDIVTDRGELRSICGIVTESSAGDSDGGLASYQLVIRDALSIMEKRTNTRVFRNRNEVEIVQVILDEWRHTNPIIGTAFDYETAQPFASQPYPQREFTMQYNESDAAFIRRLLKRRGISWFFRADGSGSPSHTMVLFDEAVSLQPNAAGTIRYHRDGATEQRDTITAWCAVRSLQPGRVTRFSWDYKKVPDRYFMSATAEGEVDQGASGNVLSASLDDYLVLPPHAGDNNEDLCRLGQLAMNRHDYESKCFHGEGSVRDLCVGEYFTLEGHPEIDDHEGADREFVVTEIQLAAHNNLPKELAERVTRLFDRSRWSSGSSEMLDKSANGDSRVKVRFTAVRNNVAIAPAYDPRTEQPNAAVQSAIVVGPEGEEVYCDQLGRVKIRFQSTRQADHEHAAGAGAADNDVDSAWVRVATSWAGNGPDANNQFGMLTLPRVGSEVLLAFIGGDPDRPVIVGQLYNQAGPPPSMSVNGNLPGDSCLSGLRSREIRGIRANRLTFDDTRGEISARLASDHGNTQLGIGFLTTQRMNGRAKPRGEGAELYSERAVSIRGESGLLIAAGEFSNSGRQMLDAEPCESAARLSHEVSAYLADVAERQSGDVPDDDSLGKTLASFENWKQNSGCPIVAVSAAGGIINGTNESIVLAPEVDLHANSGKNTSIGAGGNILARAAKGVSVLACKLGIKLIAAGGDIKVQSKNGSIEISTSKKILLIANESIEMHSPTIKLIAQGAQIECSSGRITQQSSGIHTIKSSKFEHRGAGDGTPEKLDIPSTEVEHDQQVLVTDLRFDKPLQNQKYRIKVEDGQVIEGTTDANGLTERFSTKTAFASYEVELLE